MMSIENWIRLAKIENPKKALALVEHFGGPDELFHASAKELMHVGDIHPRTVERIQQVAVEPVDKELASLEKVGGKIITYWDENYPANLRQIFDPPPVLFVLGELREEDRFAIAVVGTRRPTEYGHSMATKLSRDLARRGLTVVSGLARGIDTIAHTAAIQAGRTIAVLGSGIDVPYPYENRGLMKKISENGAIISEFAPGTQPESWRFPVRNRLVSGLALGVVVIESGVEGGAMITATLAADQGRDVWAVPGPTDSATSQGTHKLIKEGAKLIEHAEDVLEDLGIEAESTGRDRQGIPSNLTTEQKAILQVLNLHPKHVDEIIGECKLTAATANSALTILEMLGLIRRVPGNAYVRAV
ncbi:MAG: DNA-processing protein DprA [Armatimonadota bacterium]|nr:DNA-processing protein DprA [Armatimonadota bacterium]